MMMASELRYQCCSGARYLDFNHSRRGFVKRRLIPPPLPPWSPCIVTPRQRQSTSVLGWNDSLKKMQAADLPFLHKDFAGAVSLPSRRGYFQSCSVPSLIVPSLGGTVGRTRQVIEGRDSDASCRFQNHGLLVLIVSLPGGKGRRQRMERLWRICHLVNLPVSSRETGPQW